MRLGPALSCLLVLVAPQFGCKSMLYPLARAFGSPSEGELKRCRATFEQFKSQRGTARIVVHSALDPRGPQGAWEPRTADQLVALMQQQGMPHAVPVPAPKDIDPTPLGANQMRYTWKRAHAYADWIRRTRPEGDFFVFVELLRHPAGEIVGIQTYVLAASGDIAYARQLNSHQFGRPAISDPQSAIDFLHGVLQSALSRPADAVFPPYGVG